MSGGPTKAAERIADLERQLVEARAERDALNRVGAHTCDQVTALTEEKEELEHQLAEARAAMQEALDNIDERASVSEEDIEYASDVLRTTLNPAPAIGENPPAPEETP